MSDKPSAAATEAAKKIAYSIHSWRGRSPEFMTGQVKAFAELIGASLSAERQAADDLIAEYACHLDECKGRYPDFKDCECGLNEAVAALKAARGE